MKHHTADDMLEQCRAMMGVMHGDGTAHMPQRDAMMGGMMQPEVGMLLMLLLVGFVMAITVAILWLLVTRRRHGGTEDPRRILQLRYARGEVDRDTFLRMRADLVDGTSTAD